MKKISAIAILALLAFTACKNGEKSSDDQMATDSTDIEQVTTDTPIGDTSRNALDWPGVYSDTLPCGDCPGLLFDIQLNDNNTYALSLKYLEKQETANKYTGTFTWDDSGNVITLDANGDHKKLKVQEHSLKMLDKFGNPEQGDQSDYIIKKID